MSATTDRCIDNLLVSLIGAIADDDPQCSSSETLHEVLAAAPEHRGWLLGLAWGRARDDDVAEAIHALAIEGGFTPPYEGPDTYPSAAWAVGRAILTLASKSRPHRIGHT